MSVREYIGARYVPVFADPAEWDATRTYEPLTVVTYQGNSYTSRQAVPANIAITNTVYWAQTGNYNAQVEQYREEVATFDGRIEELEDTVSPYTSSNTVQAAIQAEANTRQSADSGLQTSINNEASARQSADNGLSNRITTLESLTSPSNFVVFGDSWNAFVAESRPNWFELANIGNVLNTTLKNFGIGGAGYVGGSSQISAQITTAGNTLTNDEKAKTKYVVFLGGVNDTANNNLTYSTWLAAIRDCLNSATLMFPNAKILFAVNSCSPYYATNGLERFRKLNSWARMLCDDLTWNASSVLVSAQTAYFWGPTQPSDIVYSDLLHPNRAGAQSIGKIILTALSGGSTCVDTHLNNYPSVNLTIPSGGYSGSIQIGVQKGDVIIYGSMVKTGDTYEEVRIDIPRKIQEFVLAKAGLQHYGQPLIGINSRGDSYMWFRFANDATQILGATIKADTYFFA